MKISIIVATRNEGPALNLTLRYFEELRQQHHLEVVVIDDASDQPVDQVPRGFLLHREKSRQGIARTRNLGAALATGDLLLFTDAHVFFSEHALTTLIHEWNHSGLCGCQTQLIYDFASFSRRQSSELDAPHYSGWKFSLEPEVCVTPLRNPVSTAPQDVPYVGGAFLAVSRELFWTLGGFDAGLIHCGSFEDAELAMTAWATGYSVRMIPRITCYHYTAPQPKYDPTGRSPLDVPRYEGSFLNALRTFYLHFPEAVFAEITVRLKEKYPLSWSAVPPDFPNEELRDRKAWLNARRVRSPEWVYRRMTTSCAADLPC